MRKIARFSRKKLEADSHSIRPVFDAEKQDLAIFHAKYLFILQFLKFKLCYKYSARPNHIVKICWLGLAGIVIQIHIA
ncbi:hypothetical protein [Moraxella bovis]|uniref:hypothetical protein n=1 Tax=Moraxella bovis TaxID=476 RepID=UPI0015F14A0B|nr:hypothetical protein [Moraxella bovis]